MDKYSWKTVQKFKKRTNNNMIWPFYYKDLRYGEENVIVYRSHDCKDQSHFSVDMTNRNFLNKPLNQKHSYLYIQVTDNKSILVKTER